MRNSWPAINAVAAEQRAAAAGFGEKQQQKQQQQQQQHQQQGARKDYLYAGGSIFHGGKIFRDGRWGCKVKHCPEENFPTKYVRRARLCFSVRHACTCVSERTTGAHYHYRCCVRPPFAIAVTWSRASHDGAGFEFFLVFILTRHGRHVLRAWVVPGCVRMRPTCAPRV